MATLLARLSRCAATPDVLGTIGDKDCNLAIWQRPAFADFAPLIEGAPQDLRFVSNPAELPDQMFRELRQGGFGGDAGLQTALIEDAGHLARLFCAALDLATFEIRLEVVRTDSCRKFHADYVTARLITTYVGEGTDWLEEEDAARVAAGQQPLHIHRLGTFDVGLFKGKLGTERPAIHRSPPIGETAGGARLLLVLNPASRLPAEGTHSPLPQPLHLS